MQAVRTHTILLWKAVSSLLPDKGQAFPRTTALVFKSSMRDEEIPGVEDYPCPKCGGIIAVVKMNRRFLGRYTCPHCGEEVLLTDQPDA